MIPLIILLLIIWLLHALLISVDDRLLNNWLHCNLFRGMLLNIFFLILFSLFFFSFSDILIQGFPVLPDGEFFIIVHLNLNDLANGDLLLSGLEVFEVFVLQGFLGGEPVVWVENEQFSEHIQSVFSCSCEKLREAFSFGDINAAENIPGQGRFNGLNVVCFGLSGQFEDSFDLV